MTALEEAIIEILSSAPKLTTDKARARSIFRSAGIIIDDRFLLISLTGGAEVCITSLMDKLSSMPVIKVSAKRILRNMGLSVPLCPARPCPASEKQAS